MRADVFASLVFRGTGVSLSSGTHAPSHRYSNPGLRAATAAAVDGLESRVLMSASLLPTIPPAGGGGGPTIGDITYFAASDASHGTELWKSDGTAAGTSMVADLNPGSGSSNPTALYNFNGTLYFEAFDGTYWNYYKTDGTAAGTSVVYQTSVTQSSEIQPDFTAVGNELYFFGQDASKEFDLLKTDGTPTGTSVAYVISQPSISPDVGLVVPGQGMVDLDGTLYFMDGQVWKLDSDGQVELIKTLDIANPNGDLIAFNHDLYFVNSDPSNPFGQADLWQSDGTAAGTRVFWPNLADLGDNLISVSLSQAGNYLYFVTGGTSQTQQLYRTDGTASGTFALTSSVQGAGTPVANGNQAYFETESNGNTSFWITDGTPAGTVPFPSESAIRDIGDFMPVNGLVYFVATSSTTGQKEIYQTDGTSISLVDPSENTQGWKTIEMWGQSANGMIFYPLDSQDDPQLWSIPTASDSPASPPPPSTSGSSQSAAPSSTLVPTLGHVDLKLAAIAGARLDVNVPVTITNSGTNLEEKVTVDLYAEIGTTLDGSQVLLSSKTRHISLKANQRTSFAFAINSLPASLQGGTYNLIAEVIDPSGNSNTIATSQTVQVSARLTEPVVSIAAVSPAALAPGRVGSISVTVTNNGNVASTAGQILLGPSADGLTPLPGVTLDSVSAGLAIPAGKSRTYHLRFKVPSSVAAGTYLPTATVSLDGLWTTTIGDTSFTIS